MDLRALRLVSAVALVGVIAASGCRSRDRVEAPRAAADAPAAAHDAGRAATPEAPTRVVPSPTVQPRDPARAQAERAALATTDDTCADCHPEEAEAWWGSRMGRTLRPLPAPSEHPPFGTTAELRARDTPHLHTQREGIFEIRADESRALSRSASVAFGSGTNVFTYAWAQGEQLFQVPVSWYADGTGWSFSPGFEDRPMAPDFFRPITLDCLTCHTDPVTPMAGTRHRLLEGPTRAFGCNRCHGDGRAHAEGRARGEPVPIASPANLSAERAADVCGFCHAPGATRVLRDGRDWPDFRVGGDVALSDVVAVFERETRTEGFGTLDQATRLALSLCKQRTPQMTCTTCHQPHPDPKLASRDRSEPCRSCHGPKGGASAHACAGPADDDCVRCHMDTGGARNIPHVTATDHFIRRAVVKGTPQNNDSPLLWVANPVAEPTDPDHQILLGRAYANAWLADRQPRDAERAERWLGRGLASLPKRVDGWISLAVLRRQRGDAVAHREAAERGFALAPGERAVAIEAAGARLGAGDASGALAALEVAIKLGDSAELQVLRAQALRRSGRGNVALSAARAATVLQPSSSEAWLAVGVLERERGGLDRAAEALRSAGAWEPRELRVWMNLGQVELVREAWAAALEAWQRAELAAGNDRMGAILALRGQAEALLGGGELHASKAIVDRIMSEPEPPPGMTSIMGRLLLAAGNPEGAKRFLEAALAETPDDPLARAALQRLGAGTVPAEGVERRGAPR